MKSRVLAIGLVAAGLAPLVGCGSDGSKAPTLALVSADCHISTSSPIAGCAGQVKNLTSSDITGVQVDIAWLDSSGKVVARSKPQLIGVNTLLAGGTADWQVESDYGEGREGYRIEFIDSGGKTLETVDQSE